MTAGERIRGWREGRGIFKITRLEQRVRDCPIVASRQERQVFGSALLRDDGAHIPLKMRDRLRASELLGRNRHFAGQLRQQFEGLIQSKQVRRLPGF